MARNRLSNLERALKLINKKGTLSHKKIVKHLLTANGLQYNEATRKRYDKLFYGVGAPLRNLNVGNGEYASFSTW